MTEQSHPLKIVIDNVTLEQSRPQHDARTVTWLNEPHIRRTFGISRPITLDVHRAWLQEQTDLLTWAIHQDEAHVGNCNARQNGRHRSSYIQIYLGETSSRGKGIGTKAVSAMLDYLFDGLDMHRVWLHVFPENARALKLYERLGFRSEGFERDAVRSDDGFRSHMRMSVLAPEWIRVGASW